MIVLSRHDVESLLTITDALEAVEEGFRRLSLGEVTMPQRLALPVTPHAGLHLSMPAFVEGNPGALTVKIVTVYRENGARFGLPMIQGVLLVHDPHTGRLLALMDAEHLTAVRTGAASGVATKHLARADAESVLLFGAGALAPYQLEAVCAVRPIRRAWVITRSGAKDASFCAAMSEQLGIPVAPAQDVRRAVGEADVICTATNSQTPLFDGAWLSPGVHINAVGAYTRTMRELDAAAIQRSRIVVDRRQAALNEAGDIVIPLEEGSISTEHIAAELGEIVAGRAPGRTSSEEITVFKSVGLAMQDAVVASMVYARAMEQGLGLAVEGL